MPRSKKTEPQMMLIEDGVLKTVAHCDLSVPNVCMCKYTCVLLLRLCWMKRPPILLLYTSWVQQPDAEEAAQCCKSVLHGVGCV